MRIGRSESGEGSGRVKVCGVDERWARRRDEWGKMDVKTTMGNGCERRAKMSSERERG